MRFNLDNLAPADVHPPQVAVSRSGRAIIPLEQLNPGNGRGWWRSGAVSSVSEQAVFALLQLLLKRRIIADSKDLKKGT